MSADTVRLAMRAGSLATLVAVLGACSWFTDFKEQPKPDPWESADSIPMRGNPQNSVSIYGSAAPGYAVSRERLPGTIDSMATIANPVQADARSLENGHKYFAINCAVCHGFEGKGDGAATKYGMPGIALAGPGSAAMARSDGYIWGMIRNGRGLMPSYNRIEELDRWDVVNYVRGLQGKYQVATGPLGVPGETGDKVPGFSQMGPTRPSPWYGAHGGSQAGPSRGARDGAGALQAAPAAASDTTHVPVDLIMPGPGGPAPRPGVPIPTTTTPKTGGER